MSYPMRHARSIGPPGDRQLWDPIHATRWVDGACPAQGRWKSFSKWSLKAGFRGSRFLRSRLGEAMMLLRASAILLTTTAAISPWQQHKCHRDRVIEHCRPGMLNRRPLCCAPPIRAMTRENRSTALTGVIFEPFIEVQNELVQVSKSFTQSLARQRFSARCEAAVNEQINVEYNVSYIYHALFAYFDRDNVGLPGFAKYFREASDEERMHAEMLMKYQNIRGGRVKLHSIVMPVMEFDNAEKGDALYAMELALSLEKLTNEKLHNLHHVAQESNDGEMTDYIEGTFLSEQVKAIKQASEYVAQLRRIGKGHGVWHFDQMLLHQVGAPGGRAAIA